MTTRARVWIVAGCSAMTLLMSAPGVVSAANTVAYPEADLGLTQSDADVDQNGGPITLEGDGADPGSDVDVYVTLPSTVTRATLTERVVASTVAGSDGSFTVSFSVPSGLPPATYSGAVVTRVNGVLVRAGFQFVVAATSGVLPRSGSSGDGLLRAGAFVLVLGAAATTAAVRRRFATR